MRVFLDTNILLEYLCARTKALAETTHERTCIATNDASFTDFEDSMQYQCAIQNGCDYLITFNVKDYKNASQEQVKVVSPEVFLKMYKG